MNNDNNNSNDNDNNKMEIDNEFPIAIDDAKNRLQEYVAKQT